MSKVSERDADIGIVIVTHADYGQALVRAAEIILGPQDACQTVSVDGTQEVSETVKRLREAVSQVDAGRGALILTDMFGGTPTNLSLSLLAGDDELEVLTGINLPMLLKVFSCRKMELAKLADEAKNAGGSGIVVAGQVLRSKVNG